MIALNRQSFSSYNDDYFNRFDYFRYLEITVSERNRQELFMAALKPERLELSKVESICSAFCLINHTHSVVV